MVKVSFFPAPVKTTVPSKDLSLREVYNYIVSPYAKETTAELRRLSSSPLKSLPKDYKAKKFDFVTFSGTFSKREAKGLITDSGLICIDFDHIGDEEELQGLKAELLKDDYFETQLLFRSPSGDGLKWVIPFEPSHSYSRADYFHAIANYIQDQYRISPDLACKDVCRGCFLPYDPDAYINKEL